MYPTYDLSLANILPPATVLILISTIWSIYTFLHLLPKLQLDVAIEHQEPEVVMKGWFQLVVSQGLSLMLVICYARAVLTLPGQVPEAIEWWLGSCEDALPKTREVKYSGERRRCKHCLVYKPDRCHHCRICKCCILKMDHHCPWIMNCVGFRNHKYFFLLVVYSVLSCAFISTTIWSTVSRSVEEDMPTSHRFLLVLCLVSSSIVGPLLTAFLGFHSWLMTTGLTTIEFCEKSATVGYSGLGKTSQYDLGSYGNLKAVLGPRPFLWLLPLDPPEGDGVRFAGIVDKASINSEI